MRTIAVVNQKGGSGKSTLAVNVSAALAERGATVTLIDLDPQCSATRWLGYEPLSEDGLSRVLSGDSALQVLAVDTEESRLSLVPGDDWLEISERRDFDGAAVPQLAVERALTNTSLGSGLAMIDTPGRLSLLTIAALAAADEVLVPVPASAMELEHVHELQDTVAEVRAINPGLADPRLALWSLDARTVLAQDVWQRLIEAYPDQLLEPTVRKSVRAAEAFAHRQPLTRFAPDHPITNDVRSLAEAIEQGVTHVNAATRAAN